MAKKKKTSKKKTSKRASSITRRELLASTAAVVTATAIAPSTASASSKVAAWRTYALTLSLQVPRVYSNEHSTGCRKYQLQKITAKLKLGFSADGTLVDAKIKSMVNKTHKLSSGKNVTYDAVIGGAYEPRFNAIGNNKTGAFRTASVCFSVEAEPSYSLSELSEDTSLYITLAGKGDIDSKGRMRTVSGYAAGTIGCGCKDYGHISPTRTIGYDGATDQVDDVAAVHGSWAMKLEI